MDQWPLKLENLHLYAVDPQNDQFNQLKVGNHVCILIQFDTYNFICICIRTYFEGWETKVSGDWRHLQTKLHGHQQAPNDGVTYMLLHDDGFLSWCLPVWSGCRAPRGSNQPQRRGRSGCGCCIGWNPNKTRMKCGLHSRKTIFEHPPLSEQENSQCFHVRFPLPASITRKVHIYMSSSCLCMFMPRSTHSERCQGLSQYG